MEDFSTPRRPLLPIAANLCTLAVVISATWWSAAQRSDIGAAAAQQQSSVAEQAPALPRVQAPASVKPVAAPQGDAAQWTLSGKDMRATVATLQPVGYQATSAKR